jgi:IclR helix-turn-helix domain
MFGEERRSVSITLSTPQVEAVVRAAASGSAPGISALLADSLDPPRRRSSRASARAAQAQRADGEAVDRRLSRSLLRGLSLLRCFDDDGSPRGIVELAGELDLSPSTVHRYAVTLVELGLLQRCPDSRKYRLPES